MNPGGPTDWPTSRGRPTEDELAADAALVDALARAGCEGDLWSRTAARLAALGVGALHAIVMSGRLEAESAALGRPIRLRPGDLDALRDDDHARREIVDDAVVKALDLFRRRTVLSGVWTTSGGARLDTYFVNGAVMALANPIRHWLLVRRTEAGVERWSPEALDTAIAHGGRPAADPVEELLDREDTAAVLDWLGPVLGKAALLKIYTGWSWARVAPAIGLSPRALERRLRRFRDRCHPTTPGSDR